MDSKFDYIDNVAAAADGDVMKKQTSPIKAIVLLIVGAGVLYYGAAHLGGSVSEVLSSTMIIVGLIIVVWGIAAFFSKRVKYIYKPTGKVLKKYKVYVAPNYSSKLYQMVEDGKYEELKSLPRVPQSNLSIEALCGEDGSYAMLQVLEFVPYNDIPTTPVKVCQGEQAKYITDFLR